ncbi:hypothetical protein D3C73_1389210 [compost metagenome]
MLAALKSDIEPVSLSNLINASEQLCGNVLRTACADSDPRHFASTDTDNQQPPGLQPCGSR